MLMKFNCCWINDLSLVYLRHSHYHLGLRDKELGHLSWLLKHQLSSFNDLVPTSTSVLLLSSVGGEGSPARCVHFLVYEHWLHQHLCVVVRGACEQYLFLTHSRRSKIATRIYHHGLIKFSFNQGIGRILGCCCFVLSHL